MPGLRLGAWLLPRGRRLVRGERQGQGRALLQAGPGAGTESRKVAGFPSRFRVFGRGCSLGLGRWPGRQHQTHLYLLALVTSAATNTEHGRMSCFHPLGKHGGREWLNHTVIAPNSLLTSNCPFNVLISNAHGPILSTPVLANNCCFVGFHNSGHTGCHMVSRCGFDLLLSNHLRWGMSFHALISHLCVFDEELSIQVFCPFSNWMDFVVEL